MLRVQINRLAADLRGQPVFCAYCSVGSMIHFDFGEPRAYTFKGEVRYRGDYVLMIETARWSIARGRKRLASSNSPRDTIYDVLPEFLGKRVLSAVLTDQRSVLRFENGLRLGLYPRTGPWDRLANWTLFDEKNKRTLSLTASERRSTPRFNIAKLIRKSASSDAEASLPG